MWLLRGRAAIILGKATESSLGWINQYGFAQIFTILKLKCFETVINQTAVVITILWFEIGFKCRVECSKKCILHQAVEIYIPILFTNPTLCKSCACKKSLDTLFLHDTLWMNHLGQSQCIFKSCGELLVQCPKSTVGQAQKHPRHLCLTFEKNMFWKIKFGELDI